MHRTGNTPYLPATHPLTIKELYLEHIILFKDAISYVLSFEEATGMTRSIENIDESHSTGLYPIGD